MSSQPSGSTPSSTIVEDFRKPPLGALIFFGLVALAGLALLVRGLLTQAVATCQGSVMSVGELCSMRSRRSGSFTQDYQTRLDVAEATLRAQQLAGALVLLAALATIVVLVITWRRDVRLVEGLGRERPDQAHIDRGLLGSVFGAICAILLLGAGGFAFFFMQGASGLSPVWSVILGAVILAGLVVLVMSRPRGATALLAYPHELGVVSRGKRVAVPFSDVQYFVGERTRSFNWLGSGRSDIILSKDESPAFRDALAQRAHTAWFHAVPQRIALGETVDFGAITVRQGALTISGVTISPGDLNGIRAVKESEDTFYEAIGRAGNVLARVDTSLVAHTAILRQLLAPMGITLP